MKARSRFVAPSTCSCIYARSSLQGGEAFNVSVVLDGLAADDAVQMLIRINGVEWRRFGGARASMELSLGAGLLPPGDTVMPRMVHTIEATALVGGSAIATAARTILLDDRRWLSDEQVPAPHNIRYTAHHTTWALALRKLRPDRVGLLDD